MHSTERMRFPFAWCAMLVLVLLAHVGTSGAAQRESDIQSTLHNLSTGGPGGVKAASGGTSEICVFCHTPHGASSEIRAPLWNRTLSAAAYSTYASSSLDVDDGIDQPTGGSKLCLSCHDGTVAIGQVTNQPGSGFGSGVLAMTGAEADGTMPAGEGETTGFTRRIGTDLRNDHPISFTYDDALAAADGELSVPSGPDNGADIGTRSTGKHDVPLFIDAVDGQAKLQCTTCHDPHVTGGAGYTESIKFLRLKRFQDEANAMTGSEPNSANGPGATFSADNDIVCLACHDKMGWEGSAHANPAVADERYLDGPAALREFPGGIRVWQAACLNCHDTHAVSGSRRLLREGVGGTITAGGAKGGFTRESFGYAEKSAIEETCYQCHTDPVRANGDTILANAAGTGDPTEVPDIESDFALAYRMPITTGEQASNPAREVHDISSRVADSYNDCVDVDGKPDSQCGADFIESQANLGNVTDTGGTLDNRHAECTDCHNPHRVVKSACFNGSSNAACDDTVNFAQSDGTHDHSSGHTNLASGVLRGAWGVEPTYPTDPSFYQVPTGFTVKRGDPATVDNTTAATWVTREYQVCLKCHSNYGYDDADLTTDNWRCTGGGTGTRPLLQSATGGPLTQEETDSRTGFDCYTNQAREFAPFDSVGSTGAASTGSDPDNHRSWHPVMAPTGRPSGDDRDNNNWLAPWNGTFASGGVGAQTMYCTDCHGADNTSASSVVPAGESGNWGPHGSSNRFILKGTYSGTGGTTRDLCLKCHDSGIYNSTSGSGGGSAFCCGTASHQGHRESVGSLECNWCHIAVPHGWKNRSLLVNLKDVGPEAGEVPGTEISNNSLPYTKGPYYRDAYLKIFSLPSPGNWSENNCGGGDWMTDNCVGG